MREIEVGVRYDLKNPPAFFGIEEVNTMLNNGATVTALLPGAVLAQRLGDSPDAVELTISGFALKVRLREPGALAE